MPADELDLLIGDVAEWPGELTDGATAIVSSGFPLLLNTITSPF